MVNNNKKKIKLIISIMLYNSSISYLTYSNLLFTLYYHYYTL